MPTETLTWKDEQLTTELTDTEAAAACERMPANHHSTAYARTLVADLRRYGSLFASKRYWLHALAYQQIEREQEAANPSGPTPAGTLPRIAAFLTPVSNRVKSGAPV